MIVKSRLAPLSALAIILPLAVAGCAATPNGPRSFGDACSSMGWGTMLGGAIGGAGAGLLASGMHADGAGVMVATIGGLLLGGAAGSRIDDVDCMKAQQARTQALSAQTPIGQTIVWDNPKTGASGSFTPMREGRSQGGETCREFQQTIIIGGENKKAFGTACLQKDGSWKIANE